MEQKNKKLAFRSLSLSIDEQTIVAQCTPQGAGAIAVIRLSGSDSVEIASCISSLPSKKSLLDCKSHTINFGYVIDRDGQHIDQVLFLLMHAPRTFTGQNIVEITCHNNQFLIERIIDLTIEAGARLAGNGEFSQRAVINGKIDLAQAEAMNDLIHAQTEESLKYSLQQLEGSLSSQIFNFEQIIIKSLALCEASFEFLDEEEMEFATEIRDLISKLNVDVSKLLKSYKKQQFIKEGVRIAIIGAANAGKSSLFNCLIDQDRAIVTEVAGTTRDAVEKGVYDRGSFLTFIDTAGIRETSDKVEKYGIDISFQEAKCADLILLVVDGSEKLSSYDLKNYSLVLKNYSDKIILIQNKSDLSQKSLIKNFSINSVPHISVSVKNRKNIDELKSKINDKIGQLRGDGSVSYLLNKRQHSLLSNFSRELEMIDSMLDGRFDYELIAYHLRESLKMLSEVSGRSISEAAMDKVFKTFCVGK